jgi:hypothetical protein
MWSRSIGGDGLPRETCGTGLVHLSSNLSAQAEKDFASARRKALLRRIGAFLRRDRGSNRLLSFEEAARGLGALEQVRLGIRDVPVSKIVGSVGRYTDFDRAFLPSKGYLGERWKRIDRMMQRSGGLPPVSLYKIGGDYFVLDGNHRVSVARYHGVERIDAQVIECHGRISEETWRPDPREHRVDRQNRGRSNARTGIAQSVRLSGRPASAIGRKKG